LLLQMDRSIVIRPSAVCSIPFAYTLSPALNSCRASHSESQAARMPRLQSGLLQEGSPTVSRLPYDPHAALPLAQARAMPGICVPSAIQSRLPANISSRHAGHLLAGSNISRAQTNHARPFLHALLPRASN